MSLVLGVDPGLASLGYAKVRIQLGVPPEVVQLGVFRTEKSDAKRKVKASDDNLRRLCEIVAAFMPTCEGVDVFCAESMSFPRNSSAAAKVALIWGMLGTLCELREIPMVQSSPKEIKQAVCGRASASKVEVGRALDLRFERDFVKELGVQGIPRGQTEHAYDALGAVVAALNSDVLRMASRKM